MKRHLMKNYLLLIALLLAGLAEQKSVGQTASSQAASSQVEGVYNVKQMTVFLSGKPPQTVKMNKPGDRLSATITAKRKSERYVNLTFLDHLQKELIMY